MGAPEVDAGTLFVATRAGALIAVETETGQARWRFETGGRMQAAPVAQDGLVYVATDASDSGNGSLFAVDARTGTEHWRVALDAAVTSRPVADGRQVYVPAGDVVALDALTGEERWRAAPGTGVVSLAAGFDVVVAAGPRGLVAFDAQSGDDRWTVPTTGLSPVAPGVAGKSIVAGDGVEHLVGRDPGDGVERWRTPDPGLVQPPVAGGQVVVLATRQGVVALSSATGERRWQVELTDGNDSNSRVQVATDGTVAAATADGRLRLFDALTGEALGTADLDGGLWAAPAVTGERTYVAEGDTVAAFDRPVD